MYFFIAVLIIVIILSFVLFYKLFDLKNINNNLDVAEVNLQQVLDKKKELLYNLRDCISDEVAKKIYPEDKDLDLFELEESLFNIRWEFNKLSSKDYKDKKEVQKVMKELNNLEDDIEGLKDFYNTYARRFNLAFVKKPFTLFYKLFKLNEKKLFNYRKLEQYEILKED